MTARPYTPEDYPTISPWWTGHGWPAPISPDMLHSGIIITDDRPLAAGFYFNDPAAPFLGFFFLTTAPHLSPTLAHRALCTLIITAENHAKAIGKRGIFSACQTKSLARLFLDAGWSSAGTSYDVAKNL